MPPGKQHGLAVWRISPLVRIPVCTTILRAGAELMQSDVDEFVRRAGLNQSPSQS